MIRTVKLNIVVFVTLTTLGCASPFKDVRVETQANPKVNFDGYRSYAWGVAAALVRDPNREWAPPNLDIAGEIKFLVNRELRAKGMTEVFDSPDVLVIYAVGVDMKALDVVDDPKDDSVQFKEVPKGGLMVILADPESRSVMWVGSAVADIMEEPTAELGEKRLDYAVKKMFKNLPR
jgi:hypothetical protein